MDRPIMTTPQYQTPADREDLSSMSCRELDQHIKSLSPEDIEALLAEQKIGKD